MREAGIEDVRRLRFFEVAVHGQDDLTGPGEHSVSESVATEAVRRLRRRGRVLTLLGLLLFTAFVVGANLLVDRAEELLANGVATPGVVVGVSQSARGSGNTIDVRFAVGGVERDRTMNLDDSGPVLAVGDRITVFYDRHDPENIAAPGVSNDPSLPTLLVVVAFALWPMLLPPGLIGLVRWGRRARAVRVHGWRRAQVEAHGKRLHRIHFPANPSAEPSGSAMTVVTTYPVVRGIPPEFRTGEVLVGGHGRRVTLVFTRGPVLAAARTVRG
ncbi:DUF3592 domain-containing protein [Actinokineospora iranica]|uniref:DUF3592 domain-containing protein n=1 Tax=Actinokineospora iranica TaxID=1271860 RepID=UPI0011143C31|nr:DUF3592 domain-containing protein [Actinokineospora iranica]